MKIIAISGSLRKASTNTGLLRKSIQLSPPGMKISLYSISDFPLYNDDLCIPNKPQVIHNAYKQFSTADGFLFGIPCYNHSLPSPLKNMIDWISRDQSPLRGKSLGYFHSGKNPKNYVEPALLTTVQWLQMKVYLDKKIFMMVDQKNFDKNGNLINQNQIENIKSYLNQFDSFVKGNKKQNI